MCIRDRGETPGVLTVRRSQLNISTPLSNAKPSAPPAPAANDGDSRNGDHAPKLYQQFVEQQRVFKEQQAKEADAENQTQLLNENSSLNQIDTKDQKKSSASGPQQPHYKLVYSYPLEYEDFLDKRIKDAKRPKSVELLSLIHI
eukprot:TRINITY_DN33253_c0_g1_i1.p1 TRINITY_DN33253_c0_g1~~TRINITY_DN33253_c0_g1_i1.p1  ORF type:complete len:163 (-),score=41.68 TRINITY_DN33253_c0_g1_i1:3-434(-)